MPVRTKFIIPALLTIGAVVFLAGINWGLPSRDVNPYLFGNREIWSGEKILKLAGPTEDADRGADVSSHAAVDRGAPVIVNGNDADRARIVRRYRLMSYQPDEWNTLKALSEMKPGRGNFDPKLYQYGGLWVYPVGAMLKAAAVFHLIDLRADAGWYLDHPDAFGRFYVVARLWSVLWGLAGVLAVSAIVRRIVGGYFTPALAAIGFIFMPVVVNMAHEAKPHLPGAVLMLLAVLAASRYAERGTRSAWILAGALCGAALGMVLTTLPIFLILPAMVLLRPSSWREKIRVARDAAAIGLLVYVVTNPYVPINFIWHRAVLESNIGNSKAMYHPRLTLAGIANAAYLIAAGTSPLLALAGLAGAATMGFRAIKFRASRDAAEIRRRSTGLLLAIPSLAIFVQCLFVATGKPGEFGRFFMLSDIFLLVEAMVALHQWHGLPARVESLTQQSVSFPLRKTRAGSLCHWGAILLIITTIISGFSYVRAFVRDSGPSTSRLILAAQLHSVNPAGSDALAVYADPAPYCLPPIDLFEGEIILLPKDAGPDDGLNLASISIRPVDLPDDRCRWLSLFTTTPISWADKRFDVRTRSGGEIGDEEKMRMTASDG